MKTFGVKRCLLIISFILTICSIFLFEYKEDNIKDVIISEVVSSNGNSAYDYYYAEINEGRYDWVELYNPTDKNIDITNYRLIYNKKETCVIGKIILPSKESVVVYCTGEKVLRNENVIYADFTLGKKTAGILSLVNSMGQMIDSVEFPALEYDEAYGRKNSSSEEWGILEVATPGTLNGNKFIDEKIMLPSPKFSREAGVYKEEFDLEIYADYGEVYYTLDGSIPDEQSLVYKDPIRIRNVSETENRWSKHWISTMMDEKYQQYNTEPCNKAVVVRARTASEGVLSEEIITKTYFIGVDYSLPVVSVVADPEDLFGDQGIMVAGNTYSWAKNSGAFGVRAPEEIRQMDEIPGNFMTDLRIEGHIEMFDEMSGFSLDENISIKLAGAYSRFGATKSMKIEKSNETVFENRIFQNQEQKGELENFVLRGTGGEFGKNMLADVLAARMCELAGVNSYEKRPCIVFLNGEYWGIYYITEGKDENYFLRHFGIPEEKLQIVKYNMYHPEGIDYLGEDSRESYLAYVRLVQESDMKNSDIFYEVSKEIDLDYFCRYLYIQLFCANSDWPHNNVMAWRSLTKNENNQYEDGKWRFLAYDFDDAFREIDGGIVKKLIESDTEIAILFAKFMENDEFAEKFIEGLEQMFEDALSSEKLIKMMDEEQSRIEKEISEFVSRWTMVYRTEYLEECLLKDVDPQGYNYVPTVEWHNDNFDETRTFIQTRKESILEELKEYLKHR